MKRLFWVGVGVAATLRALHVAREVTDRHVPAGARSALGAAAGVTTLAHRAVEEFRAGVSEREAELRADLLAGADLGRSRARVDAWRAERAGAQATAHGMTHATDHTPDDAGPRPPGARPGSAADAGRRHRTGARPEDPDDGSLGYSFF